MSIGIKGKEILKKSNYDVFREAFIDSIMQRISVEGKAGTDIRTLIAQTLEDEKFDVLIDKLLRNIAKETDMDSADSRKALSILLEEDVAGEITKNLPGQVQEKRDVKKINGEDEIYKKGETKKLWGTITSKRLLGQKTSLINDIFSLLKKNNVIKFTFLLGLSLLNVSALLLKSIYKAITVGLTLTAIPGESTTVMIANIIGGFGGILIFFVSFTLIFQYTLLSQRRDEQIQNLAQNYLAKKK